MPIPLLLQTGTQEAVLAVIPFKHPLNHPDVIWVNTLGEALTIDRVRVLEKDVLTKPYSHEVRVFVIQNLELATIEAQQALLKLFEEPPKHIRLILTTEYPSMLLGTILSRVQIQSGSLKSDAPQEYQIQLADVPTQSIGPRLLWASNAKVLENPVGTTLQLLSQQIQQFEQSPTLEQILRLQLLKKTLQFLQAKTNPKLCLEWFALHY